jgi:hypothetical protein
MRDTDIMQAPEVANPQALDVMLPEWYMSMVAPTVQPQSEPVIEQPYFEYDPRIFYNLA